MRGGSKTRTSGCVGGVGRSPERLGVRVHVGFGVRGGLGVWLGVLSWVWLERLC